MCSVVLIMLMNSHACEPPNKSVELGHFPSWRMEVDMRRCVIFIAVMIIACLMTAGLARPQSAGQVGQVGQVGQGKWSEKARLPEPRGEVAVAWLTGRLYVLGGSA